jgi:hypothetical protein
MNNMDNQAPSNDPELDELLKLLRETPARDPRAVERGRAKFISELDQMFPSNNAAQASWLDKFLSLGLFRQTRENKTMKLSYSIALVALVIALFLFSGAGITAYAAQSALPGDALYTIKTSIEQTQVRLAADAAKIAELHLEFAERRLEEISGLIIEGRYGDIDRATQEFEYHVQQALTAMQTVAAGDPLRAQALAVRVTAALTEYARSLSSMMINVPEDSRASIQRALDTSQGAGSMTPGEFSENENAAINENINDDSGNTNGNDNDQSNQNSGIGNENENENDNGNTNLNSNENDDRNDNQNDGDDQNSNSNLNDRNDDNENDSDHDNDNDNRSENDNDNDRNDNDNDNDNHNDNGSNDNGGDD